MVGGAIRVGHATCGRITQMSAAVVDLRSNSSISTFLYRASV
jgi:hypothetical protein